MSKGAGEACLRQEAAAIALCAESLGEAFETAIRWIVEGSGRTITCGVGKSGHIARKTAGTLSSTGTPSLFLHAAEAVHGDLGMVTSADIVILYSHSGETDEIVRLFVPIAAIGARTILITGRPESSAGRSADLVLNTHVGEEACPNNLAPTTSTTVMLALSDALAIAVMTQRGFSSEDFARFHPSGTLGRRLLLRVEDVMRSAEDIASVGPGNTVREAIGAMTAMHVGAACVTSAEGMLLGLISESDLRRHLLSPNASLEAPTQGIMNPAPATIDRTLLAVEAFEVFQNHPVKIGELPVVDSAGRVLGLLVLKDLLRSGIL